MANANRNTRRNLPAPRRRNADLKTRLEVAEMMVSVLCWAHPTPQHILTRSQRLRIGDVTSRVPGMSMESIVRRAVGNWLDTEAPVYHTHYAN